MNRQDEIDLEIFRIKLQQDLQSYDDKFLSFLFLGPALIFVGIMIIVFSLFAL